MLDNITVKVPATSANCGPGFDSLGLACNLYNTFSLSLSDEPVIKLTVTGEGEGFLKPSERNYAVRAVRRVLSEVGCQKPGMSIRMHNEIPMSRGLGSSSSAIVGSMVAANLLLDSPLSREKLLSLATEMEGHPDNVAPALYGGFTVSFMENGKPGCLKLEPPADLQMIAVIPNFPLATKLAREALPKMVSHADAVFNVSRTALFVASMCKNDLSFMEVALADKLHQPYRSKLIPGMEAAFQAAKSAGAIGCVISGSGSTLMAFAKKDQLSERIGLAMCKEFEKIGKSATLRLLDFDCEGARAI